MGGPSAIADEKDLRLWKEEGLRTISPDRPKVTVGMATCGLATGAQAVFDRLEREFAAQSHTVIRAKTGCIGFCEMEPIVEVFQPGTPRILYGKVDPESASRIAAAVIKGTTETDLALCQLDGFPEPGPTPTLKGIVRLEDLPFYRKQRKFVLRRCGRIDPTSLAEYIASGGYFTLRNALTTRQPDQIIDDIERAGLRGRGGAGFPTGRKWRFVRQASGDEKFVVCNADEGDPGAYMDRSLLEGDPFSVIEGMTLGAYAVGARHGFIYVRDEYPLAIERLQQAVGLAEAHGLLGENIMGTAFSLDIGLVRGGGAFVCGEETALIASVEGRAGEPRQRPPFPAQKGLWGKPTCINNVETWANVSWIAANGSDAFRHVGTDASKGTKVFSVVGKINNTGLIEVPMGLTLREIVFDIGGGIPGGKKFKAIQTGGPSGGCIPEQLLDLPVDYEGLTEAGAIMGSGGMIVMDEDTCMVDVARYFMEFLSEESCGKCTPCREGIARALEILNRIAQGDGEDRDIETLEALGNMMKNFSLCALGSTAANPVLSTIRHFRDEYEAHVHQKRCPARVCRRLLRFSIDPEKCIGCTLCARSCPAGAITGEKKKPHVVDQAICIKCGTCYEVCTQGAVTKE